MSVSHPASNERGGRRRGGGLLTGVLAFVAVTHVWVISAGRMSPPGAWPAYGHYYSLLSDAFLKGQAHLLVEPDPNLLTLPDPYDAAANEKLRLHDALLFKGKYYLYWGPVPAILLMPLRAICPSGSIPDSYLLVLFTQALLLVTGLLTLRVRRDFFSNQSRYVPLLMTAAVGLTMPVPFLMARAAIYETSIIAGQFFLLTGIWLAYRSFPNGSSDAPRKSHLRLLLAGVAWALAFGSRSSLALAVVALALLTGWRVWRMRAPGRSWVAMSAMPLVPLAVGAMLMATYNHVRFGAWHETGIRYQTGGLPIGKLGPAVFSTANLPPNFYSYALRPWTGQLDFPGIRAQNDAKGSTPRWIRVPAHYLDEHVTGVVWTTPVFLLLGVPVFHLWRSRSKSMTTGREVGLNWLVSVLLVAGVLGFVPSLTFIGSTMRYFADITPALFVVSAIGLLQLQRAAAGGRRRGRDVLQLATVLALYGALVAFALAMGGYENQFRTHNPAMVDRLTAIFGG